MSRETIFALATPAAKSGVAIIRISGKEALHALIELTGKLEWQPGSAVLASFEKIDKGLAIYFQAPKSFTGEEVVELHLHGSLAVIREMLARLSRIQGLRPAEPGEFTRRAFINHKMDLIEAEGLADLIDAETSAQKAQAMNQMQGAMSRVYERLRSQTVTTLAHLEAYIDFPDEEIPESVLNDLASEIVEIKSTITLALADGKRGEKLREGLAIVILGAPNAGKSSLLNVIAGRDAAIVSHRAGTTRDIIEINMEISGFQVTLMDTAGLRETADDIEKEGVKRALSRAAAADIKLVVFDSTAAAPDRASLDQIDDNTLIIMNKYDILQDREMPHDPCLNPKLQGRDILYVSTKTAEGIGELFVFLKRLIAEKFAGAGSPLITRSRHRALLSEARMHLERVNLKGPQELACEELRLAANSIGKITGKIAVDDVLDVVFKQFCIGK